MFNLVLEVFRCDQIPLVFYLAVYQNRIRYNIPNDNLLIPVMCEIVMRQITQENNSADSICFLPQFVKIKFPGDSGIPPGGHTKPHHVMARF